jgi:hypothetical protein
MKCWKEYGKLRLRYYLEGLRKITKKKQYSLYPGRCLNQKPHEYK